MCVRSHLVRVADLFSFLPSWCFCLCLPLFGDAEAIEKLPLVIEGNNEPHQTETIVQHHGYYTSSKQTIEGRSPVFCSHDSLKEGGVTTGDGGSLDDDVHLSPVSPFLRMDGNLDKVLFQNLVDTMLLVETITDQQSNEAFPRHASINTPPCDGKALKKAAEQPFKGKQDPDSQLGQDCQADGRAEIMQLQVQMQQLGQQLRERECQIQAVVISDQQFDIQRLQEETTELHKRISEKEEEAEDMNSELSQKQHEIMNLRSLLEKAEMGTKASNAMLVQLQEELQCFQLLVAVFLSCLLRLTEDDEELDLVNHLSTIMAAGTNAVGDIAYAQVSSHESQHMELTRRKYLAALVAAHENPAEELLVLLAELRTQLQACSRQSDDVPIGILTREQSGVS